MKSSVLALVSLAFKLSQLAMPKVSTYTRTRIELLHKDGLHPAGIFKVLQHEGLSLSFPSVACFVKKLQTTGSLANFFLSISLGLKALPKIQADPFLVPKATFLL